MSLNGSKKEEIFKLILYHHPHFIEELLNTKLVDLEYETYEERRYFDLLGIEEKTNLKILIEVQLNKSDHSHYERIQDFYGDPIDNAIIVWIAKDFHSKMTDAIIYDLNYKHTKNIDFYAITFDHEILSTIEELNLLPEKEKYKEIINFNDTLGLEIFDKTKLIPKGLQVEIEPQITNPTILKNKFLLKMLRKSTPWNLNLYRTRSRLHQSTIPISAGKSYLYYQISICRDDLDYSFIKLSLREEQGRKTFDEIKQQIKFLDELKGFQLKESLNQIMICLDRQDDYKKDATKIATAFNIIHSIVSKIIYDTYLTV